MSLKQITPGKAYEIAGQRGRRWVIANAYQSDRASGTSSLYPQLSGIGYRWNSYELAGREGARL